MKPYFVVAMPGGFAVAYQHRSLGLVAQSDHLTRESAEAEAQGMNARAAADMARATSTRAMQRRHAFTERRSVRWFEPDAYA